jgi:hypothetical protein
MEKGDWTEDLTNACCFDSSSSNNNDGSSFSAVYCGVSAGAILAGQSMQTACWKVREVNYSSCFCLSILAGQICCTCRFLLLIRSFVIASHTHKLLVCVCVCSE